MPAAKTVFMFSGQGSQFFQMGRQLFDGNEVFREWMKRLDDRARAQCGTSVVEAIYDGAKGGTFDRTLLTHPAIFMVEYSLAQCLMRAGVVPDMTLGASLGSFAAAAVAGFIEPEQALDAAIQQAKAFEASCKRGGMIAILGDTGLFAEDFLSDRSELAGVNFDSHFAVSALDAKLDEIEAELKTRGLPHQRLAVSFAFHSQWIDPAQAPFEAYLRALPRSKGRLPVVCCEQAAVLETLPEDFFWRVVRQPIWFREAIAGLERQGRYRYIDVGPSGTMATFVKYALPATSGSTAHPILTPYGQDQKNLAALLA